MFLHFERRGRCEWYDGGLKDFVSHYNRQRGTSYVLSECLDVKRNGGNTPKEPEVLVSDTGTGRKMVIERKSVVWPPAHVQQHKHEHEFAEIIWAHTKGWFEDGCYELTVSATDLENLDGQTVSRFAALIGSDLARMDLRTLPVQESTPVHWEFRRVDGNEYGDKKGVVVVHQRTMAMSGFSPEVAIAGIATEISKQLGEAALKFPAYTHARRLVLLDFFGNAGGEDEMSRLLCKAVVPACIDEIWITKPDWTSEEDYEIGFQQVFVRAE